MATVQALTARRQYSDGHSAAASWTAPLPTKHAGACSAWCGAVVFMASGGSHRLERASSPGSGGRVAELAATAQRRGALADLPPIRAQVHGRPKSWRFCRFRGGRAGRLGNCWQATQPTLLTPTASAQAPVVHLGPGDRGPVGGEAPCLRLHWRHGEHSPNACAMPPPAVNCWSPRPRARPPVPPACRAKSRPGQSAPPLLA